MCHRSIGSIHAFIRIISHTIGVGVCCVPMSSLLSRERWWEAAGPTGVSRCGATEPTGLGPSGCMCANHNLFHSAAAPFCGLVLVHGQEGGGREGGGRLGDRKERQK